MRRLLEAIAELSTNLHALRLAIRTIHGTSVFLVDVDGTCIMAEGDLGSRSLEGMEGKNVVAPVPGERKAAFASLFQTALDGRDGRADYPIADEVFDVLVRPVFEDDGKTVAAVMFYSKNVTSERAQQAAAGTIGGQDTLTGLPRRGILSRFVDGQIAKRRPFSLMFFDVDRFKQINDTYGHAKGDQVLVHLARAIQVSIRPTDLCTRIGGDEFVIVISETGPVAREVARRIVQTARGVVTTNGGDISHGIAEFPKDGDSFDALMVCADARMYRDKLAKSRAEDR